MKKTLKIIIKKYFFSVVLLDNTIIIHKCKSRNLLEVIESQVLEVSETDHRIKKRILIGKSGFTSFEQLESED